jgi:hypothetical protein
MKRYIVLAIALSCCIRAVRGADAPKAPDFKPTEVTSTGSVAVGGSRIDYQAVAGTLVVRAKGSDADDTPGDD